jgi:hypothetical protein
LAREVLILGGGGESVNKNSLRSEFSSILNFNNTKETTNKSICIDSGNSIAVETEKSSSN